MLSGKVCYFKNHYHVLDRITWKPESAILVLQSTWLITNESEQITLDNA